MFVALAADVASAVSADVDQLVCTLVESETSEDEADGDGVADDDGLAATTVLVTLAATSEEEDGDWLVPGASPFTVTV